MKARVRSSGEGDMVSQVARMRCREQQREAVGMKCRLTARQAAACMASVRLGGCLCRAYCRHGGARI